MEYPNTAFETAFPPLSRQSRMTVSSSYSLTHGPFPVGEGDVLRSAIRPNSTQGRSIPGNVPQTFYPYIRPDSRQNANVRMMVKKSEMHLQQHDGYTSLVLLTEAEIMHYWSTLKRRIDFSKSHIRQVRRSSGWVAYLRFSDACVKSLTDSRWRTLKGEIDFDSIRNAFARACPQHHFTRPRFLTILHEKL